MSKKIKEINKKIEEEFRYADHDTAECHILRAILEKLTSIDEKVTRLDSFVLEVSPEEALHATQELEEELNAL